MTPTRGNKRSTVAGFRTSYEQRRRRLRHLVSYASSTSSLSVPVPVIRVPSSTRPTSLSRDGNNNALDSNIRPYLVGAFIYKPTGLEDLQLHVFESHQVRVRHMEPESGALQRIANEYSVDTAGKSTFVSSMYLVQKYVPVRCSSECLLELKRKAFWRVSQQYRVNLNFKRKYVPALRHEYDPIDGEFFSYQSTVCLNVSGN
ncbi:uncharacterized protein LOC135714577 [Ochlerotatus camptorhynchus]|uniref:uncharacterized protein LOC135714577 n=1 Tax=Ochlerotatus camptorhynchus TaxID=644619 RepID=UPI0031D082CB